MTNYQRNLSTGEVEIIGSTIYHKTEYRERRNHYSFFTVNTPVDGFDTSRDEFLGLGRGNNAPIVVEEGKSTILLPADGIPLPASRSMFLWHLVKKKNMFSFSAIAKTQKMTNGKL
mgnify:FL=1